MSKGIGTQRRRRVDIQDIYRTACNQSASCRGYVLKDRARASVAFQRLQGRKQASGYQHRMAGNATVYGPDIIHSGAPCSAQAPHDRCIQAGHITQTYQRCVAGFGQSTKAMPQ